jgi:membrane-associated phospholipid phosphatase
MIDALRSRARIGLIGCLVLVPLAVLFVDRAASTWSHATLHGQVVFIDFTFIAEYIATACGIIILLAGIAWICGRDLRRHERVALATALAVLAASAIKDQLKLAFGRTWPETWVNHNPSWIDNGVFGFFPYHGGAGWASFPSGHTTVSTAAMTVLWCAYPPLRPILWIPVALVVVGLLGADYHFVGDMLAGGFLGTASGVWIARLSGVAAPAPVRPQSAG